MIGFNSSQTVPPQFWGPIHRYMIAVKLISPHLSNSNLSKKPLRHPKRRHSFCWVFTFLPQGFFLFPHNLPGSVFLQEVFATGFAFAALKKDGSVVTWGATRRLALECGVYMDVSLNGGTPKTRQNDQF